MRLCRAKRCSQHFEWSRRCPHTGVDLFFCIVSKPKPGSFVDWSPVSRVSATFARMVNGPRWSNLPISETNVVNFVCCAPVCQSLALMSRQYCRSQLTISRAVKILMKIAQQPLRLASAMTGLGSGPQAWAVRFCLSRRFFQHGNPVSVGKLVQCRLIKTAFTQNVEKGG